MKNKIFILSLLILFSSIGVEAGILPTSRGGTGANITPSANAIVTSTASGFALSTHITLGAGTTVAGGAPLTIPTGSTLAATVSGSIESNGTHIWWTDNSGIRHLLDNTGSP